MRIIKVICILIITFKIALSNMGGAVFNPSIIGSPVLFEKTDLSISSEQIYMNLFATNTGYVCKFQSIYNFAESNKSNIELIGIFYGLRAKNVTMMSDDKPINYKIDDRDTKILDSLFFEKPLKDFYEPIDWFDKKPLFRYGYKYLYKSNRKNNIIATGDLYPEKTNYWGIGGMSYIPFRHPALNKNIVPDDYKFQYLIEPISSWKSVGNISITFNYPKNIILYSNVNNDSIYRYSEKVKPTLNGEKYCFSTELSSSYPDIIDFKIRRRPKLLCIGGPIIGIGAIKDFGTIYNLSWETAINLNYYHAAFIGIGYETNFKDYKFFVPNVHLNSVLISIFGLNIGLPYDISSKLFKTRLGFSCDLSIVSLSLDWDYNSGNKEWKKFLHLNVSI